MRSLVVVGLGLVLLAGTAAGPQSGDDATADRVAGLVGQLGDAKFARREEASRALEALGEPALPALRREAAASGDAEIRQRLAEVIRVVMLGCRLSRASGIGLALIDPGTFAMGDPPRKGGRPGDPPQHDVRITRPFLIGTHEVTQEQYRKVSGDSPSWFAATHTGRTRVEGRETGRFPVEEVTWYDAIAFCNRLSELEGYPPYYTLADPVREGGSIRDAAVTIAGGNGYRLPTEAEWEYACRAGSVGEFHQGVDNCGREANFRPGPPTGYGSPSPIDPLDRTAAVGSYPANVWGLHDMHGNVAEWCWDWYGPAYYDASPVADPPGPADGLHRVVRGGSWLVNAASCGSAVRFWRSPDERTNYVGFRVCRNP